MYALFACTAAPSSKSINNKLRLFHRLTHYNFKPKYYFIFENRTMLLKRNWYPAFNWKGVQSLNHFNPFYQAISIFIHQRQDMLSFSR